ncbi:MAG: asparagine synthase (glutamine-hydrolyzing) [candidate division WOR-3 bacterium]
MCGILGIFNYRNKEPVDRRLLKQMTDSLIHRGPDAEGFYFDDSNGLGFGHRRLAIIDLKNGNQPMSDESGSTWIIYNGEIYNYQKIREELKNKGYNFKTNSDTEVLIYAYKAYGIDFLNALNGIFAFAIWDLKKKELLLARDHLGVKPLYFYDSGKTLVFASEIKALLQYSDYSKDLDLEAIDLYFTFRHTPSPKTLFKDIFKLPPGSYLKVKSFHSERITYYWDRVETINRKKKIDEWIPILNKGIESAVNRQMISDVPISLSLSSGTDSNLLLAIMSKHSKTPVNCFTIGFEDNKKYDEIGLAKISCDYFRGSFKSTILSANDYKAMFDKYMWQLEEPLGNESALAYYFVAKLAHDNGIKVLLNGQGADELFGGYHRYIGERYRYITGAAPRLLTKPLSFLIKNERLRRSLYTLNVKDEIERFFLIYSVFLPEEKMHLYQKRYKEKIDLDNGKNYIGQFFKRFTNHSSLDKMLYIDIRFSLPDDLLLAEDKMAMATSVEARVPYLDIEFLKIAESIPAEYKIKNFQFKYIHKKYIEKWLPPDFIKRKKIGFTNPMREWLSKELGEYFWKLVDSKNSFSRQFLNINYIRRIYNIHKSGLKDYKRNLFLILSLEQWYRIFFNKSYD